VAVNFIGVSEGEAQRWIQLPGVPVTIQPSEIMKIGEVMLLAMYADLMKKRMSDAPSLGAQYLYNVVLPGALVGVSCGLVIIGKHLSGTMIIGIIGLFMVLIMVDRKCRPWWAPVTILVLLGVAAAAYIVLVPYARDRFIGIFSPEADRWQSMQSLYAVGSGGLFGEVAEIGTVAVGTVGAQRELRYDKYVPAYVAERKVGLVVLVGENAQFGNLVSELFAVGFGVARRRAQKHQQTPAYLPDRLALNDDFRTGHSLYYRLHSFIPASMKYS
jgi:hypothetical protein